MEAGSIVECINDSIFIPKAKWKGIKTPVKGKLYTVTGMREFGKGVGIFIEECDDRILVQSKVGIVNLQSPFDIRRFREVLPPKEQEKILENVRVVAEVFA